MKSCFQPAGERGQAFLVVVIVGAGLLLYFWSTKENKKRASVDWREV